MKKIYLGFNLSLSSFKKRFAILSMSFLIFQLFNSSKSFGQFAWTHGTSFDWTDPTNWTPNRTSPASTDILLFNDGSATTAINVPAQLIGQLLMSNNTTVNLQGAIPAANVLTITGSSGDDLVVPFGCALNLNGTNPSAIFLLTGATSNITGNMTFSNSTQTIDAVDVGGITFNSPSIFTQNCNGYAFTGSGNPNTILFASGSTFIKIAGLDPMGLPLPNSKVVFNSSSLFQIQHDYLPSFAGRTYANLTIASAAFNENVGGVGIFNVDKLTVTAGSLTVSQTGGTNIKGNIYIASGQTLNFTPSSTNTLSFNGSSPQTVTDLGAASFTFGNNEAIAFNNAAGITFASNVSFDNLVTFTSGIVTVPNPNILTLTSNASIASASNASFVDGKVKKIGNTAFTFPVGNVTGSFSGYVPIGISSTLPTGGSATDFFTGQYLRSSAQAAYPVTNVGINHVSAVDYWILDRAGTSAPVNVTCNWNATSSNNGASYFITLATLGDLIIANSNGTSWNNFGGGGTVTGDNIAGSITWSLLTTTSGPFSLASSTVSNSLPINLNYLNGTKQSTNNYLNWKVTCGVNNSTATMSLERSADGQNFAGINSITADALRCQQPFDYTDKQPLYGMNYYRLKMIDENGKIAYSTIIAILNKESGFDIIGLMPTLVTNNAILNVTAAQKTKMDVVVTDITGKQVQKIAYNLIAGSNQFTMNFANLAAGTYQINGYTTDGKSRTIRFVKQ